MTARQGRSGLGVIGIAFLLLALFGFLSGDPWVIGLVLGFVFEGFRALFGRQKGENQ